MKRGAFQTAACELALKDESFWVAMCDVFRPFAEERRGPVAAILAEDECVTNGHMDINMRTGEMIGFCGQLPKAPNKHRCTFNHVVYGRTYAEMTAAFEENKRSSCLRLIVIRPLVRDVPPIVIGALCTCNCFTREDVARLWNMVRERIRQYCSHVLLLIGFASDGDSRR